MDLHERLLTYRRDLLTLLDMLAAAAHEMTADDSEGVDLSLMPAVHQVWSRTVDASDSLLESLGQEHPLTSGFLCQTGEDLNRIAAMAACKVERHDPEECLAHAVGNRTALRSLQAWRDRVAAMDFGPLFAELTPAGDAAGTKRAAHKKKIDPEDVKLLRRIKKAMPTCGDFKSACLQVVSDESEYERLRVNKRRKPDHWREIMGDI